ncbi:MAG: glycosyltransferase family 1 protein [Candidatus Aminicenantales bacterium]|jgi:glycosyltransferase involved in cell wall biosynthesis
MRIGFDLRPFLKEETGVGVYLRNLLFELAAMDAENEYFLFSASWKDRFAERRLPPFVHKRFRDLRWPVRAVNFLWQDLGRPALDRFFGTRLDLTHSATPLRLPTRGRTIVTVCDLFFLEDPERADREARRTFLRKIAGALRRADGVITISDFSRRGILERFGLPAEKIKRTYLGLDPVFRSPADPVRTAALRKDLGVPGEFLLFVGAFEPRKNLSGLIEALGILHRSGRKIPLVLVGRPGGDSARVAAKIRESGLEAWIRPAGYRADEDVRALYGAATALVFPSFAEGFGLPLLEAMACGLPAAVSGCSALPEIGRDAAAYFDPSDAGEMAAVIGMLLGDEEKRREMSEKGRRRAADFEWRKTAAETLEFYRMVVGNP